MNVWLLIDGYNIIGPVAPPRGRAGDVRRWLEIERRRLIDRLGDHLPSTILPHTCVVFDARQPPENAVSVYCDRGIQIQFAVDHEEADDLIEQMIASHHSPKLLTVVSSDHRIAAAARRKRAVCHDSEIWLDKLLRGNPMLTKVPSEVAPLKKEPSSDHALDESSRLPSVEPLGDLPSDDELRRLMGH